jgi:hypothetical protein
MIPTDEGDQTEEKQSAAASTSTEYPAFSKAPAAAASTDDVALSGDALVWSFGDAAIWGRSKMADEKIVVTSERCVVVRMRASHYRGLYNKQLDEKLTDGEEMKRVSERQKMVERLLSKRGTDCAKLLGLLPSMKTRRNFAVACEMIKLDGTDTGLRVARDDAGGVANGVGSSFYMVAEGKCRAGPSGFFTNNQKMSNNEGEGDGEVGEDVREYSTGQFLEEKCHQDLVARKGEKCTLLRLHSEQIRLFFATRTCRDAIRVFEGSNDLQSRLEQITCLRTLSARRRALHSCTHETMTTAIDYGFDIGIHTFQKGQYLLRAGRVASREIDMRTRQCDSFVLKSGKVAIVDPSVSDQRGGGAGVGGNLIVRPGVDGYVTAYQVSF